jgi:hypothetical protein
MSGDQGKITTYDYWANYAQRCYNLHEKFLDQKNAFLYWMGGAYVALIGATGYLGLINKDAELVVYKISHILILQVAFYAAAIYYLRKDIYATLYRETAKYLEDLLAIHCYEHQSIDCDAKQIADLKREDWPKGVPRFLHSSDYFLAKSDKFKPMRLADNLAKFLVAILYFAVTMYPLLKASYVDGMLHLNLTGAGIVVPCIGIMVILVMFFRSIKLSVVSAIEGEMATLSDQLAECPIVLTPPPAAPSDPAKPTDPGTPIA